MAYDKTVEKARSLFLFIMIIMCTLLHSFSVAHLYAPAISKMLGAIGLVVK
jgi:hypothetical protein